MSTRLLVAFITRRDVHVFVYWFVGLLAVWVVVFGEGAIPQSVKYFTLPQSLISKQLSQERKIGHPWEMISSTKP